MSESASIVGIPDPLFEAIERIREREGKSRSAIGVEALEMLARERGEWPPERRGAFDGMSDEDLRRLLRALDEETKRNRDHHDRIVKAAAPVLEGQRGRRASIPSFRVMCVACGSDQVTISVLGSTDNMGLCVECRRCKAEVEVPLG